MSLAWSARFSRLSTGVKLLIVMAAALAPLGLIAILAAIESTRINQVARIAGYRTAAVDTARALDSLVARTTLALRAASIALDDATALECRRTLTSLVSGFPSGVAFAVTGDRRTLCRTAGYRPVPPRIAPGGRAVTLDGDGFLTIATRAADGRLVGTARLSPSALLPLIRMSSPAPDMVITLHQGDRVMRLHGDATANDLVSTAVPVAGGQIVLIHSRPRQGVTATEALAVLLPILMVVAAGTIAFLVMDRTILVPLRDLQAAVLAYRAGDRTLEIPRLTTPAHELRTLADSFRSVTDTIVRHEGELEEGLARQTRLTREVHHRVKNNLQVVASLLNLHARGATSQDVADAYAAIQRRVDALAVVHRNHYAELEESKGVAMRPLIGELAANLRATAPIEAAAMPILLDLAPLHASQDVAVPAAFLITELVEAAMLTPPVGPVRVALTRTDPTRALLSVTGQALRGQAGDHGDRFERVLTGLSRQLRTTLERDEDAGRIAIALTVVAD